MKNWDRWEWYVFAVTVVSAVLLVIGEGFLR